MADVVSIQERVPDAASRARRGLAVFFAALIPLSVGAYWLFVHGAPLAFVFVPAASSIIARLALREGFADVSFRLGGRRTLKAVLLAVVFPLGVGGLAWGLAWLLGLAEFRPAGNFALSLLVSATVVTAFMAVLFWGEELGWRGYMLTRLVEAGVPRPLLVSGIIWGAWHLPLIFLGALDEVRGPNVALSAALFMVAATSYAFFLGWLRLGTGAIWAPIVGHAAWNAITQTALIPATGGANALLWTGESGILDALVLAPAAFLVVRLWRIPEYLKTPTRPLEREHSNGAHGLEE